MVEVRRIRWKDLESTALVGLCLMVVGISLRSVTVLSAGSVCFLASVGFSVIDDASEPEGRANSYQLALLHLGEMF